MVLPLPPGPGALGVYDIVEATLSSPYPLLYRMRDRYGDTIRMRGQLGFVTFTGDPKIIEAVYTLEPEAFNMLGRRFTAADDTLESSEIRRIVSTLVIVGCGTRTSAMRPTSP